MKKIFKSRENRILAGVLGGVGEYLDMDPTILRLIWIVVVVFTGIIPGLIAYVVAAAIMPEKENH